MNLFLGLELYSVVIYLMLLLWVFFSIYYIMRAYNKGSESVIPYVYDSIPSVFTTLGLLGTFIGIYFGLIKFDVDNITESIPSLLGGLKTAFLTSIIGVIMSLIFGKLSQVVLRFAEKKLPPKPTGELAAFNEIINLLKNWQKDLNENFELINSSLVGDGFSVSNHLIKLRNLLTEIEKYNKWQNDSLEKVHKSLGGNSDTNLLAQIQKLRSDQNEYSKKSEKNVDLIVKSMYSNNELIRGKFDEFSELLAKNNTEALVAVMKRATEEFNSQMNKLIEKLVQENFKELNNSVQRMNQWQVENKKMIGDLTKQFEDVSNNFSISSVAIKEITENTTKLTNENGQLAKLIGELRKVMIDDTKYQEIVGQLTSAINTLKANTEAFDYTTEKLNLWVRNQMNFSDSVAVLLSRLEEIDKIKDINEIFWDGTRKQLNEGVSIIAKASKSLSEDLESINEEFYERLNDTLQNLDTLIQRIITEYN